MTYCSSPVLYSLYSGSATLEHKVLFFRTENVCDTALWIGIAIFSSEVGQGDRARLSEDMRHLPLRMKEKVRNTSERWLEWQFCRPGQRRNYGRPAHTCATSCNCDLGCLSSPDSAHTKALSAANCP
ncbi:hypothetical protein PGT21_005440 [Puccinia graminis f. sp. tritici]|uniref:Uncharacterized protein n=1 Tax=Puccinia graminis f. sp. tritici TaxID=56615 RepID=A0A5B0MEB1_PUCGR|nr:hypothetical protein PGT21_005440 [Puccinia graminis f. sp. tritici]